MIVFSILASSSLVYAASIPCNRPILRSGNVFVRLEDNSGEIGTNCAMCTNITQGEDCIANKVGTGYPQDTSAGVQCDGTSTGGGTYGNQGALDTAAVSSPCKPAVPLIGKCFGEKCLKSCVGSSLLDCNACLSDAGTAITGTPCVGGVAGSPFLGQCHAARCVISCSNSDDCPPCLNHNLDAECKIPSYSRLGRCVESGGRGTCSWKCPDTANGHCPEICAIGRQGVPCSYRNNDGRTLSGLCSQTGYCVADCSGASPGSIFDNSGNTICSQCDSGRKCMVGSNFVGMCAQGKCVVDCSMQDKPGDHGRCVGGDQYTGCNHANFGTYCVTAQGQELGVCDDSTLLGNGRLLHTCVVACKQTAASAGDYTCVTCAADKARCYTGAYHGRYDASRAVCVMDCNPQTCQQTNSNCNAACQSCSEDNGCYSTTSLDAVSDVIAIEQEVEAELLTEQAPAPQSQQDAPAPAPSSSTGGCTSNQHCRAHEICDGSVCVCDENYEKKGNRCVKVSDTILGVNKTVFAIVFPIVLLILFGLLVAFCLFRSKNGQDELSGRGMRGGKKRFDQNYTTAQRMAPRKEKHSELSARGVE